MMLPLLSQKAQFFLVRVERNCMTLVPQFMMVKRNVIMDCCSHQMIDSEWFLHDQVFQDLQSRWLVTVILFTTALSMKLPLYCSPVVDPLYLGTDVMLLPWGASSCLCPPPPPPPTAMVRSLLKLRMLIRVEMTLIAPFCKAEGVVLGPSGIA